MLSQRELLALGSGVPAYTAAVPGETHQASGCKAGEMTSDSARLWLRRTASSRRLANGIVRRGHAREAKLPFRRTPGSTPWKAPPPAPRATSASSTVDPETGLHEFGCGAASDEHAGGTPGLDKLRHKFHRVLGGYVSMEVSRSGAVSALRLRHRDFHGATVHEHAFSRKA